MRALILVVLSAVVAGCVGSEPLGLRSTNEEQPGHELPLLGEPSTGWLYNPEIGDLVAADDLAGPQTGYVEVALRDLGAEIVVVDLASAAPIALVGR